MATNLEWGLRHEVPERATVAWGARAIIHNGGQTFELLGDRQSMVGDAALRKALGRALNPLGGHDGYLARAQAKYRELSLFGDLRWDSDELFTLVDDGHLRIVANPRMSCGYLYVAAHFVDEVHETLALALCLGNYTESTGALKWSHPELPPMRGEDRNFRMAGKVVRATVVGYRDTHGYLLALVVPHEPFCNPDRYPVVGVYGCDIVDEVSETEAPRVSTVEASR